MGPQLVAKSIYLIWRNLGAALRATAIPIGLTTALALLVFGTGAGITASLNAPTDPFGPAQDGPTIDGALAAQALLASLIAGVGYLWGAVAWHRFVLLEEEPGVLPSPPAGRLLSYLWALVRLLGPLLLVTTGLGIAFFVLATTTGAILGEAGVGLVAFGLYLVGFYAMLRFSLHLPAAAVGGFMGVFESWRISAAARGAILTAAILLAMLQLVLGSVGAALGVAGAAGFALSLAVNWFSTVVGLSILTALYGHIVEGRPID